MVESSRWDATDVRVDGSEKPCGTWWRRTASYMLGIILPWALVSQAISMMATGRSLLEGGAAWLIYCAAFVSCRRVRRIDPERAIADTTALQASGL